MALNVPHRTRPRCDTADALNEGPYGVCQRGLKLCLIEFPVFVSIALALEKSAVCKGLPKTIQKIEGLNYNILI